MAVGVFADETRALALMCQTQCQRFCRPWENFVLASSNRDTSTSLVTPRVGDTVSILCYKNEGTESVASFYYTVTSVDVHNKSVVSLQFGPCRIGSVTVDLATVENFEILGACQPNAKPRQSGFEHGSLHSTDFVL